MLKPHDIPGCPEPLARSIIAYAVTIAACLDDLPDPSQATNTQLELRSRALAILSQVAQSAATRGDGNLRSQRLGSAMVEYQDTSSLFTSDAREALKGICLKLCQNVGRTSRNLPAAGFNFPKPGIIASLWREE